MILRIASPAGRVTPDILRAALETATRAAQEDLASGGIPRIRRAIRDGVRWRPEPPGAGEELALPRTVLERGWGDCDDLAPWRAAELRLTGEDPGAKAVAVRSGPKRWHAVVRRSDGSTEDPSLWAGMRGESLSGIDGAPMLPSLADTGRSAAAVVPDGHGRWHARVDLPSRKHPLHICACAHDTDPSAALIRAAQAAAYAAPRHAKRLDTLTGSLCKTPEEDPEVLGFLDTLAKTAGGLISTAAGVIPGGRQVLDLATGIARPLVSAVAPAARSVAPTVAAIHPGAAGVLQALPALQSLLSALAQGGQVAQPLPAGALALPATPIQPGVPALSLPLPMDAGVAPGSIAYSATPGRPGPVVVRW